MADETSGIITLLTDFGTTDPFVGVMKGVIYGVHPSALVVDLTHGVEPQDIVEARFWLERSYAYFPKGTVHVAVVDPGVGSERAGVVVRFAGHWFVGPDNGLFGFAGDDAEYRRIDVEALGLPVPSATFHGRDVFAPVGARLASGRTRFEEVGPEHRLVDGALDAPVVNGDRIDGQVVTIDHFGNCITNIDETLLADVQDPQVTVADTEVALVRTYSDVGASEFTALVNSFGTVEVACSGGCAAKKLGIKRGARVTVRSGPR